MTIRLQPIRARKGICGRSFDTVITQYCCLNDGCVNEKNYLALSGQTFYSAIPWFFFLHHIIINFKILSKQVRPAVQVFNEEKKTNLTYIKCLQWKAGCVLQHICHNGFSSSVLFDDIFPQHLCSPYGTYYITLILSFGHIAFLVLDVATYAPS